MCMCLQCESPTHPGKTRFQSFRGGVAMHMIIELIITTHGVSRRLSHTVFGRSNALRAQMTQCLPSGPHRTSNPAAPTPRCMGTWIASKWLKWGHALALPWSSMAYVIDSAGILHGVFANVC